MATTEMWWARRLHKAPLPSGDGHSAPRLRSARVLATPASGCYGTTRIAITAGMRLLLPAVETDGVTVTSASPGETPRTSALAVTVRMRMSDERISIDP